MECPECGGVTLAQDGESYKCISCRERFPDVVDDEGSEQ